MRLFYSLKSFRELKKASLAGNAYRDYWQAGKSVDGIHQVESAATITERFGKAWAP